MFVVVCQIWVVDWVDFSVTDGGEHSLPVGSTDAASMFGGDDSVREVLFLLANLLAAAPVDHSRAAI
jgi:hypothetical protein